VKAARKEGSLTVYTSNAADTLKVLIADFEKRYGVRVNAWRASSVKVLAAHGGGKNCEPLGLRRRQRFLAGARSVYREKLLQEVNSAGTGKCSKAPCRSSRLGSAVIINVFVQA